MENKRVVTLVESAPFGTIAMVEVGATNVGSIQQSFVPGRAVAKAGSDARCASMATSAGYGVKSQ